MICFRLSINGEYCATAGIPGHAVLTAIITWVRRGDGPRRRGLPDESLDVSLGGLDSNVEPGDDPVSLNWYRRVLEVGDRISLDVLDLDRADPPASGKPSPGPTFATRLKSARHYLKVYRLQRRELDARVRRHEKIVAEYEAAERKGRELGSRKRKRAKKRRR